RPARKLRMGRPRLRPDSHSDRPSDRPRARGGEEVTALLALALLGAIDMQQVNIVEKLNDPVPLDGAFTDSDGNPTSIREQLADGRPVILNLVYYRCPTLCSMLLGGLKS